MDGFGGCHGSAKESETEGTSGRLGFRNGREGFLPEGRHLQILEDTWSALVEYGSSTLE